MTGVVDLSPASIEALATRLAEILGEASRGRRGAGEGEMISAAEVSRRWGVSRRWVYARAAELGAFRIGGGPRPRLRFDPAEVADRLGPATGPTGAPRSGRGRAQRPRSDSLSPRTGAIVVESQIAAGGRGNAPGPAPGEVPRRASEPIRAARRQPPRRRPGSGG